MTDLERLARALCKAQSSMAWEDHAQEFRDDMISEVCAVLEEMKTPGPAALEAFYRAMVHLENPYDLTPRLQLALTALIDSILGET